MVTSDMVEDVLKFKRLDGAHAASVRRSGAPISPGSEQSVAVADALAGLTVPVQVIVGAEDRIIPPDQAKALPDGSPRPSSPGPAIFPTWKSRARSTPP